MGAGIAAGAAEAVAAKAGVRGAAADGAGAAGTSAKSALGAAVLTTPTVSGLVDRVASKGWVERQQDPVDRRRVLLRLTPEAEEILTVLETPAQEIKQQILDRLEDQEVADLARLVGRMRDVAVEIAAGRA